MRQPRVFHLLQRAHSALFRASDRALRDRAGLTATQQAILFSLASDDGVAITAIASDLRMGNSSLTGLIDRMSVQGLVERRRSDDDGRSHLVFIKPAGREVVSATLAETRRINAGLLKPFSDAERATIERFLTHVSENAEAIVNRNADDLTKERKTG
ncbi:MAG: MarR family winged helix-turn-helix transcriptional regulator [Pseudomonadota bacterium]